MRTRIKLIIIFAVLSVSYYLYSKNSFEFDEAIHYSIADEQTDKEAMYDLVYGDYPYEISDTLFISNLEKKGFTKSKIESTKNSQLRTLLTSDFGITIGVKKCETVYRDVIILKTNNKITGIAKICFGCGKHQFLGNDFYECNFDKYDDLEKLLYSNNYRN
jgi:hypothetical protein